VFDRIHGLFGRFIIEFGRFIRKINRYSSIGDGEFGGIRVMDFTVHILNADFYQILSNSDGFFQTHKIGGRGPVFKHCSLLVPLRSADHPPLLPVVVVAVAFFFFQ
jgi:hypothetical protein